MKKISALFVLILFLLSTIAVFAENQVLSNEAQKSNEAQNEIQTFTEQPQALTIETKQPQALTTEVEPAKEVNRQPAIDRPKRQLLRKAERLKNTKPKAIATKPKEFRKLFEKRIKEKPYFNGTPKKLQKIQNFFKNLPEDKAKLLIRLPRAEQKRILQKASLDKNASLNILKKFKLRIVKKENLFKRRIIAKEKIERVRKNFELAKERFEKANKIYKERKQKFLEGKEKLKKCEGVDSEECNTLKEQVKENAKQFVINSANMAIEHLEKIKNKVESAEDMDEKRADEITTEIDNAISKLKEAITKVENAETKKEIQEAAKEISKIWLGIKHREKVHAALLVHAKVWNIIKRSEHLEERLDAALIDMKQKGIEVTAIEAKVDTFSGLIADAKDNYEKAKELLEQAEELKTNEPNEQERTKVLELVKDTKELLRGANEKVKEAHKILMEIIRDIKTNGGQLKQAVKEEGLAPDEAYEVVEVDPETVTANISTEVTPNSSTEVSPVGAEIPANSMADNISS